MTVYVDSLIEWGAPGQYRGEHAAQAERVGAKHGHRWCHMFADVADCEELHAMARRIGLKREWFQKGHYDLVPTKRALAIRYGAVEVDRAQSVAIWRKQREQGMQSPTTNTMTDEELIAAIERKVASWPRCYTRAVALMRRGLKAERYECSRCEVWVAWPTRPNFGDCNMHGIQMNGDDYCSRFRAREGAA